MYSKGPMDKAKGGQDWRWEAGVAGVGESGGVKMETTILKQQFLKKEKKKPSKFNVKKKTL